MFSAYLLAPWSPSTSGRQVLEHILSVFFSSKDPTMWDGTGYPVFKLIDPTYHLSLINLLASMPEGLKPIMASPAEDVLLVKTEAHWSLGISAARALRQTSSDTLISSPPAGEGDQCLM